MWKQAGILSCRIKASFGEDGSLSGGSVRTIHRLGQGRSETLRAPRADHYRNSARAIHRNRQAGATAVSTQGLLVASHQRRASVGVPGDGGNDYDPVLPRPLLTTTSLTN